MQAMHMDERKQVNEGQMKQTNSGSKTEAEELAPKKKNKKHSLADAWIARKQAQWEEITTKLRAGLKASGVSEEEIKRLESLEDFESYDATNITKEDINAIVHLLRGLDDGSICNTYHTNCPCFEHRPKPQFIELPVTDAENEIETFQAKTLSDHPEHRYRLHYTGEEVDALLMRGHSSGKKTNQEVLQTSLDEQEPNDEIKVQTVVYSDIKRQDTEQENMNASLTAIRNTVGRAQLEAKTGKELAAHTSYPKSAEALGPMKMLVTEDKQPTNHNIPRCRIETRNNAHSGENLLFNKQWASISIQEFAATLSNMSVTELEIAVTELQLEWRNQQELATSDSITVEECLMTRLGQLNTLLAKKKTKGKGGHSSEIRPGAAQISITKSPSKAKHVNSGEDEAVSVKSNMTTGEIEARMSELKSEVETKIILGRFNSLPQEEAAQVIVQLKGIGAEYEQLSQLAMRRLGKNNRLEKAIESGAAALEEPDSNELSSIVTLTELQSRTSEVKLKLNEEQQLGTAELITERELSQPMERMGQTFVEQGEISYVCDKIMMKEHVPNTELNSRAIAGSDPIPVEADVEADVEAARESLGLDSNVFESMKSDQSTQTHNSELRDEVGDEPEERIEGISLAAGGTVAKKPHRRRPKKKPKSQEPVSSINERLGALRQETLQIEDRNYRYRNLILYHTQLWQELKRFEHDEERYEKLLQICRSGSHSQILINDNCATACRAEFENTVELLIVVGRDQSAIDKLWEESVGFDEKAACSIYVEEHQKLIRSRQLERCLTNIQVESVFLHPISWYFVCRTIAPLFRYHWKKELARTQTITGQGIIFEYTEYILQLQPLPLDWPEDNTKFLRRNCHKVTSHSNDWNWNLLTILERTPDTKQGLRSAIERLRVTEQQIEPTILPPFLNPGPGSTTLPSLKTVLPDILPTE